MEDARCHLKRGDQRVVDSLRYKLKKPIAKDEARAKKRRRGWWKSALHFWKRPELGSFEENNGSRRSHAQWSAGSGPVYSTDTGGVGRRARRPSTGLLLAAAEVGADAAAGVAYVNLRDLSLGDGGQVAHCAVLPPAAPIYLVT